MKEEIRGKDESTALSTDTPAFLTEMLLRGEGLNIKKPFSQRIFLMNTFVAGVTHVRGIKSLAKALKKHEEVLLVREPKNEYDELAILVKNKEGKKLGYIPRQKNEAIARLMDAGKCFEAEVVAVKDNTENERNEFYALVIRINVYMVD